MPNLTPLDVLEVLSYELPEHDDDDAPLTPEEEQLLDRVTRTMFAGVDAQ